MNSEQLLNNILVQGSDSSHKKVSLMGPALHPFLVRSYTEVLKDYFEKTLISSQEIFSTAERYEKILDMIPDESVAAELRGKWQDNRRTSSADINVARWEQLKHLLQSGKQKMQGLRRCVEEIAFAYTYPRLDMELIEELNNGGLRTEVENELDRTSLGKSIRFFQSSFLEPLLKSSKEEMISSYNAKLQQSKNVLAAV